MHISGCSGANRRPYTHHHWLMVTILNWMTVLNWTLMTSRNINLSSEHCSGQCTVGRFDIATAVMTVSKFRANPRQGHMNLRDAGSLDTQWKWIWQRSGIRTTIPDLTDVVVPEYDWSRVYGNVQESIPTDLPHPLGKSVQTVTFVDANLMHDCSWGEVLYPLLISNDSLPTNELEAMNELTEWVE